ncbi:MAG: DUF523 and DUF1722 domain-containing protein [Gemmatimonadota bacterium]|nr:MAG: DUF523 and DUF1722 domain-containing protein [Gemmatimonadota bacterium]
MSDWPKPVVVLSRCLELEPVRYNGQVIPYDFVRELEPWVSYVPVCPEVEIGLGVPRDPIRIVEVEGEARLVQPDTDRDVSEAMRDFSDSFLGSLGEVDGFLLKNRSPSCGLSDVKIFQGFDKSASSRRGSGFFGGAVLERYPGLALEDEGRLRNYRIRDHFLTKLFALARFRAMRRGGAMRDLVRFQAENKLLLMAYSQKELRVLGRIVANPDKLPFQEVVGSYEEHFQLALARPPRSNSVINVFEHAAGYFSKELTKGEKAYYRSMLKKYRERQVPVSAVSSVLRAWIVRFEQEYLLPQTFFEPYPEPLMSLSDSGKGREV